MALNTNSITFVIYITIWEREKMLMHFKNQAQIKAQVGVLLFNKAFTKILVEYFNYSNVFSAENAAELPENTRINKHAIKLEEDKQPFFKPIYSLGSVKLKTLKTYIKIN